MIAYFILVHRFPAQFKRMFELIYDRENHYLVHIDKNSEPEIEADIRDFLADFPGSEVLDGREALWGGYSLVDAELRGMARLLEMGANWEFFINLSGQDYPLKSQNHIAAFLSKRRGQEFIKVADQRTMRPETISRVGNYVVEFRKRIVRTFIRRPFLKGASPYIGNQWMIVSRRFCEFVCHDPQAQRYKAFYKNTFIADEGFFQTVMMNTGVHGQIVNDDLRMIDWVPDGDIKLRPRTFNSDDAPALLSSACLFARKFDAEIDEDILDIIDARLLRDDLMDAAPPPSSDPLPIATMWPAPLVPGVVLSS